jgi:hypothetical protein
MLYRSVLSSKQTWHTVFCAVYTTLLTATQYSSEYSFIMLMFHPINHYHNTKESSMCHSVPVLLHACFNPLQYSIPYSNAMKQEVSQMQACTQNM